MGDDEPVYYRADVQGLSPGDPTTHMTDPRDGQEHTYATTNLEVARAFALGVNDGNSSVYRVELADPIMWDREIKQLQHGTRFLMSHGGTVTDVVEKNPAMTPEEAREVMSQYARWARYGSRIYDHKGYATVPPALSKGVSEKLAKTLNVEPGSYRCTAEQLRQLGLYPPPFSIVAWAEHIAAMGNSGPDS